MPKFNSPQFSEMGIQFTCLIKLRCNSNIIHPGIHITVTEAQPRCCRAPVHLQGVTMLLPGLRQLKGAWNMRRKTTLFAWINDWAFCWWIRLSKCFFGWRRSNKVYALDRCIYRGLLAQIWPREVRFSLCCDAAFLPIDLLQWHIYATEVVNFYSYCTFERTCSLSQY